MEKFLEPTTTHRRDFRAEASAAEGRTVELSFSSEEPVTRYDWLADEYYTEILDHSAGAVDLTRLESVGSVLFNHDSRFLPVARIDKVWLDETARKGRARITFDEDEEAERILAKVRSGSLRGVSVGYGVSKWEEIKRGKESGGIAGPAKIARRWQPFEISIVTVPADSSVGVGRSMNTTEDKPMEETTIQNPAPVTEPAPAPAPAPTPEPAPAANNGVEAERARCAAITELCRAFGMDPDEHIRSGASVSDVNAAIVERMRRERAPLPVSGSVHASTVNVDIDAADKFRAAAADGLRLRLGAQIAHPASGAEEFRGAHLIDLAREVVERKGERVSRGIAYDELAKRAMATSDFPLILGNVADAILKEAYAAAPSTWRGWCAAGSLSDFKVQRTVRLSETGNLELIPEGGEYTMAEFTEAEDGIQLFTFGKKFSLTRQAIVNDDLRAFTRLPQRFGSAAARTINHAVYALLVANPKTYDNKTVFHSAHNNLAAAGAALSADALSAARAAMRRQTGLKGDDALNISPAYLIIPPEIETAARQLMFSETDLTANASGVVNVFRNSLSIIVEAELADTKAWYLAAAPAAVDTFEVAFLDGVQSPFIEQRESWNTDGIEYKVRLDFGVKCWDYRGLYKNPGPSD